MKVGLAMVFQNFLDQITDTEAYDRDIHIASLCEPLGFDMLASAEHHFFNYGMAPDNIQLLSHMAARTNRIGLLTAAVIVPWHNPVRVVENMIVLDHLSKGRALFGIGRGLARREYDGFGVDMNESRERFNEGAEMILRGLETGFVEGDGTYYKQSRVEVRPRPYASFRDRVFAAAQSEDSVPPAAKMGAALMVFAKKPWTEMASHFDMYRELYVGHHNRPAPPPLTVDFMICDESADRAEALAREHLSNYYSTVLEHYEMLGDHFKGAKGYGEYADNAARLKDMGEQERVDAFLKVNTFGTPQQILDQLEWRRQTIGDFDFLLQPSFGGLSLANAEGSLRLFAEKVLPEIRSWRAKAA